MRGSIGGRGTIVLAVAALAALGAAPQSTPPGGAPPELAKVQPAEFGETFPVATFQNLNTAPGQPATIDLATLVGKKPIVLFYWMANNARSEEILVDTEKLVDGLRAAKGNVALLAVAAPSFGSTDVAPIKERISALKLHVPVLYDRGFPILQELGVRTVPFIAIVDKDGKLRLSNGGSLSQTLEYKMDVAAGIKRVAETGQLGTYGPLPLYYPVVELIGKKYLDFTATAIGDGQSKTYSSLFQPDKMNVLVFWSVDCPHCQKAMPQLNDWLKTHPQHINVVSAARVTDDATEKRTEEYCKLNKLVFPTFVDKNMAIGSLYQIVSTPTLVIIRPNGVIDSVLLSGETDLGAALQQKEDKIFKTAGSKG